MSLRYTFQHQISSYSLCCVKCPSRSCMGPHVEAGNLSPSSLLSQDPLSCLWGLLCSALLAGTQGSYQFSGTAACAPCRGLVWSSTVFPACLLHPKSHTHLPKASARVTHITLTELALGVVEPSIKPDQIWPQLCARQWKAPGPGAMGKLVMDALGAQAGTVP